MYSKKAVVISNRTVEGISVIDIDLYDESGRKYNRPTKGFIDSLNAVPWLDEAKIQSIVAKKYGVPLANISFLK